MIHSQEQHNKLEATLAELAAHAPPEEPSRVMGTMAGLGLGAAVLLSGTGAASAHETPESGTVAIEQGSNLTETFKYHGLTLPEGLAIPENARFRHNPDLVQPGDLVDVVPDIATPENIPPEAPNVEPATVSLPEGWSAWDIAEVIVANTPEAGTVTQIAEAIVAANGQDHRSYKVNQLLIVPGLSQATVNLAMGVTPEAPIVEPDPVTVSTESVGLVSTANVVSTTAPASEVRAPSAAPEVVTPLPNPEPTDVEGLKAQEWHYFTDVKNLPPHVAAGIMGNFAAESNHAPGRIQGKPVEVIGDRPIPNVGFGKAQWTFEARQKGLIEFAESLGVSPNDSRVQLDYFMSEIESPPFSKVYEALMASTTVEEASDIIMTQYERPKDQSEAAKQIRRDFANAILAQFTASQPVVPLESVEPPETPPAPATPAPAAPPTTPFPETPAPTPPSAAEAAEAILENPNVLIQGSPNNRVEESFVDTTDDGKTFTHDVNNDNHNEVSVSAKLLEIITDLTNNGHIVEITSLTTGEHSENSDHYKGMAVDFKSSAEILRQLWEKREEYRLDELIFGGPLPDGVTNLKNGQPFKYSVAVLEKHKDHGHVSTTE